MNNKNICFVIGPMSDMNRLNLIAHKIVAPIVSDLGYRVETPDQPDLGMITDHIFSKIERSKMIIADISFLRPSVIYELAICHSMGRPTIIVKEKNTTYRIN